MKLPKFRHTSSTKRWTRTERKTAAFIQAFWVAASQRRRRDPEFLWFLTAAAWTNVRSDGSGAESTREWRNEILAEYLGVGYETIGDLAAALHRKLPALSVGRGRRLLYTHTGITHHYTPIRPRTRKYVLRHASELYQLFKMIASRKKDAANKTEDVARRLARMPNISTPRGGWMSPFNPLSPVLACLDPHRRFPIMNQRTNRLLKAIGKDHDGEGAVALSCLIGSHVGVRDSFELDVYSMVHEDQFHSAPGRIRRQSDVSQSPVPRVLPIKSEIDSIAVLARRRVAIRKEHNKLTNRFRKTVFANVRPREARFDLLIDGWKGKRKLLIEAKTDWKGSSGRTQIRQAIGQLFDYRLKHFANEVEVVDLAVLVPTEPSADVKELLRSLRIALLWFHAGRLNGTIQLY